MRIFGKSKGIGADEALRRMELGIDEPTKNAIQKLIEGGPRTRRQQQKEPPYLNDPWPG